jgi:long-chain alkane monooxygenase
LIVNAFEMAGVGYYAQGTWSHPNSERHRYKDRDFWVQRAKLLDEAGFDALFFTDVLGVYDVYRASFDPAIAGAVDSPLYDPFLWDPATLTSSENLSFVVTALTSYENPFGLVRKFATLDHSSKGRVGWNLVTSYLPNAARNHGFDDQGEFLSVQGPALTEPSVQRTPVLYQAGASAQGLEFAADHVEVVFVNGLNRSGLAPSTVKLREAVRAGRAADDVKVVTDLSVVLGRTRQEAEERADDVRRAPSPEAQYAVFGGASGFDLARFDDDVLPDTLTQFSQSEAARFTTEKNRPDTIADINRRLVDPSPCARTLVGSADDVVTEMETISAETGVDGFNLHEFVTPRDFEEFSALVMPILRSRGLTEPPTGGKSHRKNLFSRGADKPFQGQRDIVRYACDHGINHFDLANQYGPPLGAAEENFGRILAKDLARYREEPVITTKAGWPQWLGLNGRLGGNKHLLRSPTS